MNIFDLSDNAVVRRELEQRLTDWDQLPVYHQNVILSDVASRFKLNGIDYNQCADFVANYVETVESQTFGIRNPGPTNLEIWTVWASLLNTLNYT